VSDVFWGVAGSNSQDGGETLVDTPIKCFLPASFDFLAFPEGPGPVSRQALRKHFG
jgi:hypothetical protein